ncbi:MAG: hypothetical protein ACXWPM_12770 [Bdellovibrionota bacterium]
MFPRIYVVSVLGILACLLSNALANSSDQPSSGCKAALSAPLFKASSSGSAAEVTALLNQGACPNAVDSSGRTPLIASIVDAANTGGSAAAAVGALLAGGADSSLYFEGGTALIWAAFNDDLDSALALVDSAADPSAPVIKSSGAALSNSIGFTALLFAVQSVEPDLVNALLLAGAKVGAASESGTTAASLCAKLSSATKRREIQQLLEAFSDGGALIVPSYAKDIRPILQNRCSMCHSDSSPEMNWMDYSTAFKKRALIFVRSVGMKDMPASNNAAQMTDEERERVGQWVRTGARK